MQRTTRELAERISDLLFATAGSDGDMCAQDVEIDEIHAILSDTEPLELKTHLDKIAAERWLTEQTLT